MVIEIKKSSTFPEVVYIDPTGYGFWSWMGKLFGLIGGAIAGIVTGNPAVGAAVFSAISGGFTAFDAGKNFWVGAGIGLASGLAAFGAGTIGGVFGEAIGGGTFGAAVLGSLFAGVAGGTTNALLSGGNVGEGALIGAAFGTAQGIAVGGLSYQNPNTATSGGDSQATQVNNAQAAEKALSDSTTGDLTGGRDRIGNYAEDNNGNRLVAQVKHDNELSKAVNNPQKLSRLQQFRNSQGGINTHAFLKNMAQYSTVTAVVCGVSGMLPGFLLFSAIAALSNALDITLFSNTPIKDSLVEGAKMVVGKDAGDVGGLFTDWAIDEAHKIYGTPAPAP